MLRAGKAITKSTLADTLITITVARKQLGLNTTTHKRSVFIAALTKSMFAQEKVVVLDFVEARRVCVKTAFTYTHRIVEHTICWPQ